MVIAQPTAHIVYLREGDVRSRYNLHSCRPTGLEGGAGGVGGWGVQPSVDHVISDTVTWTRNSLGQNIGKSHSTNLYAIN